MISLILVLAQWSNREHYRTHTHANKYSRSQATILTLRRSSCIPDEMKELRGTPLIQSLRLTKKKGEEKPSSFSESDLRVSILTTSTTGKQPLPKASPNL